MHGLQEFCDFSPSPNYAEFGIGSKVYFSRGRGHNFLMKFSLSSVTHSIIIALNQYLISHINKCFFNTY